MYGFAHFLSHQFRTLFIIAYDAPVAV